MNNPLKTTQIPDVLKNYEDELAIVVDAIKNRTRHEHFKHVVEISKEYQAHISGKDLNERLKRYNPRESDEMFEQRKRLTESISPSVCNSLIKPFNKVSRNDNVYVKVDLNSTPTIEDSVRKMIRSFYGNKYLDNAGLDYWFKNRFVELSFLDPNCFVVIEWKKVELNQVPEPYPVEIKSSNAINYKFTNHTLDWLLASYKIKFDTENSKQDGEKYIFYGKGYTIAFEQCNEKYIKNLDPDADFLHYGNKSYQVKISITNLEFVPAFRVGYLRDSRTDGETFVNPIESAMPFLRKSLKTVSELDLTMTLHTFPQKFQYIEKCQGEGQNKKCTNGNLPDGSQCGVCKGTGVKVHTSAQDAVLLPLPDDREEMLDLNKLVHYESPPIDLIKFQDEYIRNLKLDAHYAVYNSNMFIASDPTFAKTATEVDMNMEGIYDAIEGFTEKYSVLWIAFVSTFSRIAGYTDEFKELSHKFPSDLKLKTTEVLMKELKVANDSEAPSFMRDAIMNDIAKKLYSANQMQMLKHNVRHRFFPFNGKTPTEIGDLLASPYVSDKTKILYANFESIFTEIEKEMPNFYMITSLDKQWEIVDKHLQPYIDEIKGEEAITQRVNMIENE